MGYNSLSITNSEFDDVPGADFTYF